MADSESKTEDGGTKAGTVAAEQDDKDKESETLVTPPDGGYGWVIVLAAFFCNMITDGTAFSFGVLYDDLLDHFADTKSKTSWIGSIFMGMPLLASPIASALINKFGCRTVSIIGGLISTFGFVLSYFANSIEFLCFSFGLVSGVGLAMVYTPAVVIVAFYFEKKRALATGLSVAGSGIGTLAFAPLVEYLTDTYGWRGAILILSGFMLNTCVFGALYRPLKPDKEDEESDKGSQSDTVAIYKDTVAVYNSDAGASHIAKMRELYSDSYSHSLIQFPTYLAARHDASNGCYDDQQRTAYKRRETVPMATTNISADNARRGSDGQIHELTEDLFPNHSRQENHHGNVANSRSKQDRTTTDSGISCNTEVTTVEENHSDSNGKERGKDNNVIIAKPRSRTLASDQSRLSATERLYPLYRRDIFYKGSLLWLPQSRDPKTVSSCPDLYIHPDLQDDENETQCCQWKHVKRVVKEMLDVSIFNQPLYLLFFISNFFLYMWYDIPYFYLPNSASENGLSEDEASWIISVIGIGNTIGQIAFGVVADMPRFNNSFVYGFGIFMCGVSILFIPLCYNMAALSTVGCLFGTFIGANYALCSIIIVDLLSLEKLTNAYGIVLCGQGVANLIGPPLGGLISDVTFSYVATYVCSGAFIALSGLIMLGVALHQCHNKKLRPVDVADEAHNPLRG